MAVQPLPARDPHVLVRRGGRLSRLWQTARLVRHRQVKAGRFGSGAETREMGREAEGRSHAARPQEIGASVEHPRLRGDAIQHSQAPLSQAGHIRRVPAQLVVVVGVLHGDRGQVRDRGRAGPFGTRARTRRTPDPTRGSAARPTRAPACETWRPRNSGRIDWPCTRRGRTADCGPYRGRARRCRSGTHRA